MIEVSISEACDVNPPKPKLASLSDDTSVLFVPMAAVDEVSGTVSEPEFRSLGEVRKKSFRSFQPGDVIFAKITPCMENGKCAVVPPIPSGIGFGSTEFHVLRPKAGVDPRYIWHFVRQDGFRRHAREAMTGTVGQERVPASFLAEAPMPLTSADAQQVLADLLDSSLAAARSAGRHLEAARRAVTRFRQATFAAASSGRLTADWREANPMPVVAPGPALSSKAATNSSGAPNTNDLTEVPETWAWWTIESITDVMKERNAALA